MCVTSKDLQDALEKWKTYNKDKQFDKEFGLLLKECNEEKLKELFLSRIHFGTAGLRGKLGPGFTCMNDVVVIQAAQGLLSYLQSIPNIKRRSIVIGYDGRHYSRRFAELSAVVFLNAEFKVYLFPDVVPTPFIPYTIQLLENAAGIMVTASHNPKEDNGYKIYLSNGAQIASPTDKAISENIMKNLEPRESSWDTSILNNHNLLKNPMELVMAGYLNRRLLAAFDLDMNEASTFNFTYTAMHGVGYKYINEVFKHLKLQHLTPVIEQIHPDPEFPTVKFPNPEEGESALDLSFKTANENGSTIILANDPDADRLAVAEKLKTNGEWKVYTGNELGALLGWWMLFCYKVKHPEKTDCSDVYFISSAVSSKILKTMAELENFSYEETLTGFKWMGNKADDLVKQGKTVLFAFEESIGYMCDIKCLDKDGISAAAHLAELILFLDKHGLTLYEKLQEIYSEYGYHLCVGSYFHCDDREVTERIFNRLRNWNSIPNSYPDSIAGEQFKICNVRDLTVGFDSNQPDCKPVLPVSKSSQMITFYFANSFVCTFRTSGTEAKIKYYTEMISAPGVENGEEFHQIFVKMLKTVIEDFLQPSLNKLTSH